MRQSSDFKYHISLIPRRWFQERHQGLTNKQLDEAQPFLTCDVFDGEASDQDEFPPDDYMGIVNAILPKPQLPNSAGSY
jgi:hypothetical protein